MITGTRLKAVMGTKQAQETLIYELIAEQLTGLQETIFQNDAMRWGQEHEDEAIALWEMKKKKTSDVVGFCISDEFPFLGLSPDRLIKVKEKYTKAVEVKAPTSKTTVQYMVARVIPKEYIWQVVNYFIVCEDLKELDFVIYDPRMIDPELRLTIITIKRKELEKEIREAKERLVAFREEWGKVYHKIKNK